MQVLWDQNGQDKEQAREYLEPISYILNDIQEIGRKNDSHLYHKRHQDFTSFSDRFAMRTQKSFLLRLWNDGKKNTWRASLEDVRNREVRTFSSVNELTAFLQQENQDSPKQTLSS
jgi:hypothetical protein